MEGVLALFRLVAQAEDHAMRQLKWTLLDFSAVEVRVTALAATLGLTDVSSLMYALGLSVGAYALMAPLQSLPSRTLREAWCLAAGVALYQLVFAEAYIRMLAVSAACYAVLAAGASWGRLAEWSHHVSGALALTYLCVRHMSRPEDGNRMTDTVPLMIFAVKLYTLGYNVHDGTCGAGAIAAGIATSDATLAVTPGDRAATAVRAALLDRQARALPRLPSPLSFLGYVFNPCTVLAGPAFEYGVYDEGVGASVSTLPVSRALPFLVKLGAGGAFLAASILILPSWNITHLYDLAVAANAGGPSAPPLLHRLAVSYVVFLLRYRVQYYGVWKLSEAGAVLGGFGYRKVGRGSTLFSRVERFLGPAATASCVGVLTVWTSPPHAVLALLGAKLAGAPPCPDWEGASNINPLSVETSTSMDEMLRHWNLHVQSWLERYVFRRLPRAGGLNKWATFAFSAAWHGFYPGYYLCFITVPLLQEGGRALNGALAAWAAALGVGGDEAHAPVKKGEGRSGAGKLRALSTGAVHWAATVFAWQYCLSAFCIFEADKALLMWSSYAYAGHVIPVLAFGFAQLTHLLLLRNGGKGEGKKVQ